MSSSKSPATICLPAHILDADISPRAREVLMLLASQATAQNPTLWVCHAAIAEKLRCSPVTVKRAIQKLVEAKLIVETGDLHERRFKFYRVKWSLNEKACVPAKKKEKAIAAKLVSPEPARPIQKALPIDHITSPRPQSENQTPLPQDSLFAQYYERARQRHQEILRRYNIDPSSFNKPDLPQWDNPDNSPGSF